MKDKWIFVLLAFFLGGLGIHRFYLGNIVIGLLYLVFCWTFIPLIISFIEGIIFAFTSEKEFNERFNKVT